jgi:hypothetical protein
MDARIDRLIDKSHLKSNKQVVAYVQERLPSASKETIIARNERKRQIRGKRLPKPIEKHYYYPVYSNHLGGYQVDLLQSSKQEAKACVDEDDTATGATQRAREYPPFFFIAINTNTKYAYAYDMKSKETSECLRCLKLLWEDTGHKVVSIRCDEEAGLDSNEVNQWAKANKVSIKTILDQNHTSLSVVDRFIRTLRDMNTPTEKTKRTSENRKYRDFTVKRMKKVLEIYNDTLHKATNVKPKDADGDEKWEREYIIKKLYESERRHKIKDYTLANNTYVKYILPRDGKKKNRYKVSPECYKIKAKDGHAYIIMAKDGSTLQVTRWRLIPIGPELREGMKMARSVNDAKHGIIKRILNYRNKKYEVLWKSPNKEQIITHEPLGNMKRMRSSPKTLTKHEEAYWKGKKMPREILS